MTTLMQDDIPSFAKNVAYPPERMFFRTDYYGVGELRYMYEMDGIRYLALRSLKPNHREDRIYIAEMYCHVLTRAEATLHVMGIE